MCKYEYAKTELKAFCNESEWQYVKAAQRQLADTIIMEYIPHGYNAISVPFPADGFWFFPLPHKREKPTGYRSRLMAWCYLYIACNLTERFNDEDADICGIVFPEDIPEFGLVGTYINN